MKYFFVFLQEIRIFLKKYSKITRFKKNIKIIQFIYIVIGKHEIQVYCYLET